VQVLNEHVAHVSVGYTDRQPLIPCEVFYSGGLKPGSDLEYQMHDMCVLISLLLQFDMSIAEIANSLSRRETELGGVSYGSLVGWVVAELEKPPAWSEHCSTQDGDQCETENPRNQKGRDDHAV
jgi:hypothetical protein